MTALEVHGSKSTFNLEKVLLTNIQARGAERAPYFLFVILPSPRADILAAPVPT